MQFKRNLYFRQLILDGQWDDILEFIQPLSTLSNFDNNSFHFHVLKAKLIELVCIKSEGREPKLQPTQHIF